MTQKRMPNKWRLPSAPSREAGDPFPEMASLGTRVRSSDVRVCPTEAGTAAHQRWSLVVDHAELPMQYLYYSTCCSVALTTSCGLRPMVILSSTRAGRISSGTEYRLFCTVQPQRPGTNPGHDSPVASSLAWTIPSSCLALSGLPATPSEHEAMPVFLALSRRRWFPTPDIG